MLPTFVIGLREGLEAALVVGIIAAFLAKSGNRRALRQVWIGVGLAIALCLAIGITLQVVSQDLPQKQQETLESAIAFLAVGMVTYMIIWMRRHARELKGHLEGAAAGALASGSAFALVVMAFLGVMREGFETAVFLLATFQASSNTTLSVLGAVLGLAVAAGLGWGIFRGGVRLDLARFFKVTGVLLVLIAAGLLVSAVHAGHEAGFINVGQDAALDLTWLVHPGTPLASIFTGVFGLQPHMTTLEVTVWLLYAVPLITYVCWPQRSGIASGRRSDAPVQRPVPTSG